MIKSLISSFVTRITVVTLLLNVLFIPEVRALAVVDSISDKIGDKVRQALVNSGCRQIKQKVSEGISGEIGCKALDIASQTEADGVKNHLINIVLMLSMVVSLINTKCGLTERGKKHLPKSYTANVTHWIHKLAALVYLYADFQNMKKNLEIFKDLEDLAASTNSAQADVLQIQLDAKEEQKASYEDKKKLLATASLALGSVAAVETGMVASMFSMGVWNSGNEEVQCGTSNLSLSSCKNPGTAQASVMDNIKSVATSIKDGCVSYYKSINYAGSLIKTAREEAVRMAISQVTSRVNNAVSEQGQGAKIMTQATTSVAGGRANSYLNKQIQESVSFLSDPENSENLFGVYNDTLAGKCITDGINSKVEEWTKQGALAAAVSATASTPAGAAAIAANCGFQLNLKNKNCHCALRNIGGTKHALAIYQQNLKLDELGGKTKVREEISSEQAIDDFKKVGASQSNESETRGSQKVPYVSSLPGVETMEEICGVDYINWGVRHDLNCVSIFKGDDELKKQDTTAGVSSDAIRKMLDSELKKIMNLDPYLISAFLNNGQNLRLIDYLSYGEMTEDYVAMALEDKKEVDHALSALGQAILGLQNFMIDEAQAAGVTFTNSSEMWSELGLNTVGMILVSALYDDVTEVVTEFHKTPFRRAILFLTSYSMTKANVVQTDATIENIDQDIKKIESFIDDYKKETTYHFWNDMEDFFNPISTAYAAPKYWPKKERPRVCLQGSSLDPNCECLAGKGKCGFNIAFDKDSELFQNGSILELMKAQVGFVQRASQGKVTNKTIYLYDKKMEALSKNMDPMVASRNLAFISEKMGRGRIDIEKASRELYEHLAGTLQKEAKTKGYSVPFEKKESGSSKLSQKERAPKLSNGTEGEVSIGVASNGSAAPKINNSEYRDSFNYENDDVKYVLDEIETNKQMNLFQKISRRYFKVIHSGRLDQ